MSLDVALATSRDHPHLDDDSVPLLEALRALGLRAEPRVWDSGFDVAGARLCLTRSTWDYDSRREEFVAWARATVARTDCAPSAAVVEWNSDKRYLRELEAWSARRADGLAHGRGLARRRDGGARVEAGGAEARRGRLTGPSPRRCSPTWPRWRRTASCRFSS